MDVELLGDDSLSRFSLRLVKCRPSTEVKTSPPMNMRTTRTQCWAGEKDSISTVDMLETVAAETDMKRRSKFLGSLSSALLFLFGLRILSARKPREEVTDLNKEWVAAEEKEVAEEAQRTP